MICYCTNKQDEESHLKLATFCDVHSIMQLTQFSQFFNSSFFKCTVLRDCLKSTTSKFFFCKQIVALSFTSNHVFADVSFESVTLNSLSDLALKGKHKAQTQHVFKPPDMDHCIAIITNDDGELWVIDPVPVQVRPLVASC